MKQSKRRVLMGVSIVLLLQMLFTEVQAGSSDQWYEPQGKPWTQDSVASHGVLTRQGSSPEPTSVGDKLLIQESFRQYNQALVQKNGMEAARHISQSSIDHYARYREMALHGAKSQLQTLPLSDRITTLNIRYKIPTQQLQGMNGKDLFVYTVSQGWADKEQIEAQSLGAIEVKDNQAQALILIYGKSFGLTLVFLNEKGEWKVDLTSLVKMSSLGLEMAMTQMGMSEDEFVQTALEQVTGRKFKNQEIWNLPN